MPKQVIEDWQERRFQDGRTDTLAMNGTATVLQSHPELEGDGIVSRFEVVWNATGYLQVATIRPGSNPVVEGEPATGRGLPPGLDGWFVNLDRAGCNDAIRALRRARDHAYGRDE